MVEGVITVKVMEKQLVAKPIPFKFVRRGRSASALASTREGGTVMYKTAHHIPKPNSFAKSQTVFRPLLFVAVFGLLSLFSPKARQAAGSSALFQTVFGDNAIVSPATEGDLQVDFDWKMQKRFGQDANNGTDRDGKPSGWTDPFEFEGQWMTLSPSSEFIQPPSWQVTLTAASTIHVPIISYKWDIWGEPAPIYKTTSTFRHAFKKQGAYPVKLTIIAADGRTATVAKNVVVRDLLIVSLGDSVASGEGNPHEDYKGVPGLPSFQPAVWANRRCHRSIYSGHAQAALALEETDPHTSVTFISLACSGAGINNLTKDSYKGKENDGSMVPQAQIEELKERLCARGGQCLPQDRRPIDALLVSIGANNIGFSDIVENLVKNCNFDVGNHDFCITVLTRQVVGDLGKLPGAFDKLQEAFADLTGNDSSRAPVFITEYFDPTKYEDWSPEAHSSPWCLMEQFVDEHTGWEVPFGVDPSESKWAYDTVLLPLNEQIRLAANKHNWNYVGGVMEAFAHHGYCASPHWIVRNKESWDHQYNEDGTMHPNRDGHQAYSKIIQDRLKAQVLATTTVEGEVSSVNCQGVYGWAWDRSLPYDTTENGEQFDHPIYVSLYEGDQLLATVLANQPDPTFQYAGKFTGNHAFVIPIPDSLKDGNQHHLLVRIPGTTIAFDKPEFNILCAPLSYEGSLDPANCDQITGYAWDKNQPTAIFDVDIFDGDTYLGSAKANQMRQMAGYVGASVAVIAPGPINHGFVFDLPDNVKDGKPHAISARFAGMDTLLSNSPSSISCLVSSFQGSLDTVNCSVISGYVWNKDQPNTFLEVDLFDGSAWLARVTANQPRQLPGPSAKTINNRVAVPGPGKSNHGFSFAVPESLKDGKQHVISAKFVGATINTGPNPTTSVSLSNSPRTFACLPPTYEGALTSVDCNGIVGYAKDKNQPQTIFSVDLLDGEMLLATVLANQPRQIVDPITGQVSGRTDNHGFTFALPASLKDGKTHSISARYSGLVVNLSNSPKPFSSSMPAITKQPEDAMVCAGKSAIFTVAASGSGLSYQWRKNGFAIAGETGSSLSINSVSDAHKGVYSVAITNACGGTVVSANATLSVSTDGQVTITKHPVSVGECVGKSVTFSVSATGVGLHYQWRKDGSSLAGKTDTSLTIPSLSLSDAGSYSVVVYNGCDTEISANAVLTINNVIEITKQPVNVTACLGQAVTFSATATGTGLHYLWRKNGGNIVGAESSSYSLPAVSAADAGSYTVVVYNGCSMLTSMPAILTVNTTSALTLSPASQNFSASGGIGSVAVSGPGCGWAATSNDPWITITGNGNGSGSGTVIYSVTANPAAARSGSISIGGKSFVITQQAGNDAKFISHTVPLTMKAGQQYTITLRFQNTGSTTWLSANGYWLSSQNPALNYTWGLRNQGIANAVSPDSIGTFNLYVTAPTTLGTYVFQWQLRQGDGGWFGDLMPPVTVTVTP